MKKKCIDCVKISKSFLASTTRIGEIKASESKQFSSNNDFTTDKQTKTDKNDVHVLIPFFSQLLLQKPAVRFIFIMAIIVFLYLLLRIS